MFVKPDYQQISIYKIYQVKHKNKPKETKHYFKILLLWIQDPDPPKSYGSRTLLFKNCEYVIKHSSSSSIAVVFGKKLINLRNKTPQTSSLSISFHSIISSNLRREVTSLNYKIESKMREALCKCLCFLSYIFHT